MQPMQPLHLALCDDEPLVLGHLEQALREAFALPSVGQPLEVDSFLVPSNLLHSCATKEYDAFFLDIDMPEKNGIDLAAEIKNLFPEAPIIFISGREEFVFDSFRVHPFAFVRKRMLSQDLQEAARDLTRLYGKEVLLLEDDLGMRFCVGQDELLYLQAMDKYVLAVAQEEKLLRCSLKKMEKQLEGRGFLRCHKSYLVNVKKIAGVRHDHITMVNGSTLPLRRGMATSLKRIVAQYLLG